MSQKIDRLSLVFKALSDPNRRKMLEILSQGEVSVSEMARPLNMRLPAAVKHLKVLEEAGLIDHHKSGRIRHCRLEEGPLVEATVWLSQHSKYWQTQFETLAAFLMAPKPQQDQTKRAKK